jgi:hypothetical protein
MREPSVNYWRRWYVVLTVVLLAQIAGFYWISEHF